MASTGLQPTIAVIFRAAGSKPCPVHVFAKGGRKWIVASDICRILGIRTDAVSKLIPEQERGHATVLSKGSVQSVTIVTATRQGCPQDASVRGQRLTLAAPAWCR